MRIDRLNELEQYIITNGTVSMDELVQHFNVSINTIRRDIAELLKRDHIKKVYGGVAMNAVPLVPYSAREQSNNSAKETIGRLAATLVHDGDVIFLDAGSTTPYFLPYMSEHKSVTIITHSLIAMMKASKYTNLNLIALGGVYNPHTSSFAGIATVDDVSKFHINTTFLAATCVSLNGLTNSTYLDAEIKCRIAKQAEHVALMADLSKFGQNAAISFYNFSDLSAVITESCPPAAYVQKAKENNITLLYEK